VVVLPHLSTSPWAGLIASTARAYAGGVVGALVVLAATGIACLFADRFIPAAPESA
jgi:hypothetical protein